jgi:hypothetical protein
VRITANTNLMPKLEAMLRSVPQVAVVETMGKVNGVATLRAVPQTDAEIAPAIGERLRASGAEIDELVIERGQLDDVFRDLTAPRS